MKKKINLAKFIFLSNFIFFITYNTYFGWNKTPINDYEVTCDKIFNVISLIGFILYILPLFKIYETFVDVLDKKVKENKREK